MSEVADDLVIEDDGVQHYRGEGGSLNVYSPKFGTIHIAASTNGGWVVKHARGMLPSGWFFDAVAHGPTIAKAIQNAAGLGGDSLNPIKPSRDLVALAKRISKWMPHE